MKDKITNIVYILSLFFFIIAFNFQDNPPEGWYQQFLPDIGGRQISDITFLDSLTGWAVTPYIGLNDTAYVLKTINGGDEWTIIHTRTGGVGFKRIHFLNYTTGFACGSNSPSSYTGLSKSTDGGVSWQSLNVPDPFVQFDDMSVFNEDTIWLAASSQFTGGVFRTTNGGLNWTQQVNLGGNNPNHVYMYDKNTGFIGQSINAPRFYKTTNSGLNWFQLPDTGFTDIYFSDSLTGWRSMGRLATIGGIKKTTDGGMTWLPQILPTGSSIFVSSMINFSNVNSDTIWGVGGIYHFGGSQSRGIIYRTTNGGDDWFFQIPDTSINIFQYYNNKFVNKINGWAYSTITGVHTVTGGLTAITPISSEVPVDFKLHQNYPNPFNPVTKIRYELKKHGNVSIKIFDVTGKEVYVLVTGEKQNPGTYEAVFNANNISSGIYFYSLSIDGVIIDTKKMLLVK